MYTPFPHCNPNSFYWHFFKAVAKKLFLDIKILPPTYTKLRPCAILLITLL